LSKVKITIDGAQLEVEKGTTVLEAARNANIHIPTLCNFKGLNSPSSCRVCVVESGTKLLASCSLQAEEGMRIKTNTPKVRQARKTVVELILSDHKRECPTCIRNNDCELQSVANNLNIRDIGYLGKRTEGLPDSSSPAIVRDIEKCILCGRCVSTCTNIQTVGAIDFINRGFSTTVAPAFNKPLNDSVCINCGQCILACPVGALYENEQISAVWQALTDPDKYVVVQTAPAVRVALGEAFGMPIGTRVTGKMVSALRKIGFDKVFDTDFAADMTIMEEGTELLNRLKSEENLPLMTSCCPGWVKFVEHNFPRMLDNLSTCKSPHEMEGALIKSYFAKKMDIEQEQIIVVSIMPCTAKKFESAREELSYQEKPDVDYVLTTRELAQMIKETGIDFLNLADEEFDNPFGEASGAGVIFGATGGVTEAALRTVFELMSGEELKEIEFMAVRGFEGIKETVIELPDGKLLRTAIIHGLGNARKVLELIQQGQKSYDFIEVMACPGGCINGGGQPIVHPQVLEQVNVKSLRASAIYDEDKSLTFRQSHKNPHVLKIYEEYLGSPNGHLSHELLHTHYLARERF